MSQFTELIKRFDKIRDYMRAFYVYGFKSRESFDKKSLRSYDNEKRRIGSYLSEYMSFYQDENGKSIFISVDSSDIPFNPLYRAFKAKTFTKNYITLNFLILDILREHNALSAQEIADMTSDYLECFSEPIYPDLSTIRSKLSEYEKLGILNAHKNNKKLVYSLSNKKIDLNSISDAIMFFSESSPLGVIGSFLLDKCCYSNNYISFKHHYIMHALESEIVYQLLDAIHSKSIVEISNHSSRSNSESINKIVPLKLQISVQGGRRYISALNLRTQAYFNYRIDYIKGVKKLELCDKYENYYTGLDQILNNTWGVSFGKARSIEKLKMTLYISEDERYIITRIESEGRNGTLIQLDDTTFVYSIEVYDTMEMLPWIRTFTGRIISLECDNKAVTETFYKDSGSLYNMYFGGKENAVLRDLQCIL